MKVVETDLPGCLILEPRVFCDSRGFFYEWFNRDRLAEAGLPTQFVQGNVSRSSKGVLRGLHFQHPRAQGKLVSVLEGEVWDVAVDIRRGSPTFGSWEGILVSAENKRHVWVPAGFAHGFVVLSEQALFTYLCTDTYAPEAEAGIRWDDPALAISWPCAAPQLSDKDAQLPLLSELPAERLPACAG